jgi:hypothetical protein
MEEDEKDDSLFRNVHRNKKTEGQVKSSLIVSGAAVAAVGLLFVPTMFMLSIGLVLIGVGVAMMVIGALRLLRSTSAKVVKSKYVR